MAMTKCKECGEMISSSAKACPHCGRRRTSGFTKGVAVVLVAIVGASIWSANRTSNEAAAQAQAEVTRVAQLTPEQRAAEDKERAKQAELKAAKEAEFQRVRSVAQAIRASAKNPASFEFVDGIYMKDGTVCITYRATNSFNAVVTDHTAVNVGNKIVDWNRYCGGKSGNSYPYAKVAL